MFRIFTDNASNLPEDLIQSLGIRVVKLSYFVDDKKIDEKEVFDKETFYKNMREGKYASTSMPNMMDFMDEFKPVLENGEDIIYIGISSGVSGTVPFAKSLLTELEEDYPERKITVIDSRAASLGEGIPVLYGARLQKEGMSYEKVVEKVLDKCDYMWQCFTVDDLKYLRKTGRIYSAAVKITNKLNIKPLLIGDKEGHITLKSVTLGKKRALDGILKIYKEKCTDMNELVGIAHADSKKDAEYLIKKLREIGCKGEIMNVMYEPVTGSHVGPGSVAMFFTGEKR